MVSVSLFAPSFPHCGHSTYSQSCGAAHNGEPNRLASSKLTSSGKTTGSWSERKRDHQQQQQRQQQQQQTWNNPTSSVQKIKGSDMWQHWKSEHYATESNSPSREQPRGIIIYLPTGLAFCPDIWKKTLLFRNMNLLMFTVWYFFTYTDQEFEIFYNITTHASHIVLSQYAHYLYISTSSIE